MGAVQEFQRSLSELGAESSLVAPGQFEAELERVVDPPAVGTRLPFDEVSLPGTILTPDPTSSQLRDAATGVTGSRLGVASLGTVAIESRAGGDELVSLLPERHVVVLRESDLEPDLEAAFEWLDAEFDARNRSFVLATGPSATGDMGALVRGVHGPKQVHVVIVTDE